MAFAQRLFSYQKRIKEINSRYAKQHHCQESLVEEKMLISGWILNIVNNRPRTEYYIRLSKIDCHDILDGTLFKVPVHNMKQQRLLRNLEFILTQHVVTSDLGEVFHFPCDVMLSPENIVHPDIIFVCKDRTAIIGDLKIHGPPDLVIEIPSNAYHRKIQRIKKRTYASFGIQEYWTIDPMAECIQVHVWSEFGYISGGVYGKSDQLSSLILPGLRLQNSKVFKD